MFLFLFLFLLIKSVIQNIVSKKFNWTARFRYFCDPILIIFENVLNILRKCFGYYQKFKKKKFERKKVRNLQIKYDH